MTRRAPLLLLGVPFVLAVTACAGRIAARSFPPASAQDVREALSAWDAAQARAAGMAPSKLLYAAHMGTSGLPSVPGTLAVTYDGQRILTASLTGPFGSRIAEYRDGAVTGEDREAFIVDPEAMRSVLAGVWLGAPTAVAGRDGSDCLLTWEGTYRVDAVIDVREQKLRSLRVAGSGGRLEATYSGGLNPWPQRVALKEEQSGRSLSLTLLAAEPLEKGTMPLP
ncbi:MAG: hypothetical protein ABI968_02700 [Acidobacteriota bacterium]